MTNQQHPITVPIGSITFWKMDYRESYQVDLSEIEYIALKSAQWGADQELEACCEWVDWKWSGIKNKNKELRADRRPKPPSETEQALETLNWIEAEASYDKPMFDTIRRALERLKKLEEIK